MIVSPGCSDCRGDGLALGDRGRRGEVDLDRVARRVGQVERAAGDRADRAERRRRPAPPAPPNARANAAPPRRRRRWPGARAGARATRRGGPERGSAAPPAGRGRRARHLRLLDRTPARKPAATSSTALSASTGRPPRRRRGRGGRMKVSGSLGGAVTAFMSEFLCDRGWSFEAERLDRAQGGGTTGGIRAEEQAGEHGGAERQADRVRARSPAARRRCGTGCRSPRRAPRPGRRTARRARPRRGTGRGCPLRRAPTALRMPISRVRSVTETSMMFITPIPPTSSEIAATSPSRVVNTFELAVEAWRIELWLTTLKLAVGRAGARRVDLVEDVRSPRSARRSARRARSPGR